MSAANFTAAIFPTRETTFCRIQPTTTVIGVAELSIQFNDPEEALAWFDRCRELIAHAINAKNGLKWCATHHEFYCSPLLSGCEWVTAPKAAP